MVGTSTAGYDNATYRKLVLAVRSVFRWLCSLVILTISIVATGTCLGTTRAGLRLRKEQSDAPNLVRHPVKNLNRSVEVPSCHRNILCSVKGIVVFLELKITVKIH